MIPIKRLCLLTIAITYSISSSSASAIPISTHSSHIYDIFLTAHQCWPYETPFAPRSIHILYDVNPSEGFNLRRDVYLRLAVFLHTVRRTQQPGWSNAKLVLPPFRNLYHWQSQPRNSDHDVSYFWNHFFDLASLSAYTDVLDMWQFFGGSDRLADHRLAMVHLRGFPNMFENGQFVERFELAGHPIRVQRPVSSVMGYANLSESAGGWMWPCSFQGSVMQLQPMLELLWQRTGRPRDFRVFVRNAEVTLHDGFGDVEFWRARRSMRFAGALVAVAEEFRRDVLGAGGGSDDALQRPERWQDEKPYRGARGGDYMCVHLRRRDFLHGRSRTTPTLRSAAQQIKEELAANNLRTLFVSSDCSGSEFNDLKRHLGHVRVHRFRPRSQELGQQHQLLGDGAVAVVDQIICSRARYFVGTFDSTFTYRIYEEREILGFDSGDTFNSFCVNSDMADEEHCERNSVWPVVYE